MQFRTLKYDPTDHGKLVHCACFIRSAQQFNSMRATNNAATDWMQSDDRVKATLRGNKLTLSMEGNIDEYSLGEEIGLQAGFAMREMCDKTIPELREIIDQGTNTVNPVNVRTLQAV